MCTITYYLVLLCTVYLLFIVYLCCLLFICVVYHFFVLFIIYCVVYCVFVLFIIYLCLLFICVVRLCCLLFICVVYCLFVLFVCVVYCLFVLFICVVYCLCCLLFICVVYLQCHHTLFICVIVYCLYVVYYVVLFNLLLLFVYFCRYYYYYYLLRDMILSLESFIQNDRELLVHIIVNLRAHFTPFLQSPDRTNVGKASVEGTVLGVIDEVSPFSVCLFKNLSIYLSTCIYTSIFHSPDIYYIISSQGISFLDGMKELWNRKGWHKGPQHKDFRDECFNWMKLLLSTVRVTEPNAHLLLKKFLAPKRGSVVADNNFRNHIVRLILEETKNSFPNLTVQMFFLLYKSFRIWPITVS